VERSSQLPFKSLQSYGQLQYAPRYDTAVSAVGHLPSTRWSFLTAYHPEARGRPHRGGWRYRHTHVFMHRRFVILFFTCEVPARGYYTDRSFAQWCQDARTDAGSKRRGRIAFEALVFPVCFLLFWRPLSRRKDREEQEERKEKQERPSCTKPARWSTRRG